MKRLHLFLVVALVACQGGGKAEPGANLDDAYKADIEGLCDVINRTGTAEMAPNDRAMTIATWLGTNVRTQDARKFLSKIRPLKGNDKANALEAEGKRVGLASCGLADEWRKVPAPAK